MENYKRVVKDLDAIFSVDFHLNSEHILIVGEDSYERYMHENAINFHDDYSIVLKHIKTLCKYPEIAHHKKILKQIKYRTINLPNFLQKYCTSSDEYKLGKKNHCYKAKHAEIKLRNKYHRKCNLKCIHSE